MRGSTLLLSVFLVAPAGLAQLSSTPQQTAATVPVPGPGQVSAGCPVSVHMRLSPSQTMHDASRGDTGRGETGGFSQHLTIDFSLPSADQRGRGVSAIDAHVQGYGYEPRVVPLEGSAGGALLRRVPRGQLAPVPFHTDRPVQANSPTTVDWTLPNATGVAWLQLDRVVFSDGSTWERKGEETCRVMLDGFLPVAAGGVAR